MFMYSNDNGVWQIISSDNENFMDFFFMINFVMYNMYNMYNMYIMGMLIMYGDYSMGMNIMGMNGGDYSMYNMNFMGMNNGEGYMNNGDNEMLSVMEFLIMLLNLDLE